MRVVSIGHCPKPAIEKKNLRLIFFVRNIPFWPIKWHAIGFFPLFRHTHTHTVVEGPFECMLPLIGIPRIFYTSFRLNRLRPSKFPSFFLDHGVVGTARTGESNRKSQHESLKIYSEKKKKCRKLSI